MYVCERGRESACVYVCERGRESACVYVCDVRKRERERKSACVYVREGERVVRDFIELMLWNSFGNL